jgi:prephenate dehydrogenase
VSAALVNAVADRDNKGIYRLLAAGGFKDITRISSSSPEMWENICLSNKDAILDFMDSYIEIFEQTRDMIAREDDAGIRDFFARAKSYRDQLLHQ